MVIVGLYGPTITKDITQDIHILVSLLKWQVYVDRDE